MLSILIPVYNYAVFPLVLELHQQCIAAGIAFEILCQDDHSFLFTQENQAVNQLSHGTITSNTENLGRGKNRNTLIQKAKYEWLLLLDADTFPKNKNFIKTYLDLIQNEKATIVFGGLCYAEEKPPTTQLLRWIYGQKREALPCDFRNKKPNSRALTSNLLLQKEIAKQNPFPETITTYGYEDVCFLSALAHKKTTVFHIDNPTFHLNLETSSQFLAKTEIALKNLAFLIQSNAVKAKESKITAMYITLKKLKLIKTMAWLFRQSKTATTKNLLSDHPSLVLFDWYKLGYLCQIYNQ